MSAFITEKAEKVAIAKTIANQFKNELGFVNRAALEVASERNELIVNNLGFVHFHHRKDGQTTIYELAVDKKCHGQGWGRLLFFKVLCAAIEKGQSSIFLKCPTDNSSNSFYSKLSFILEKVIPGKKRSLNCWRYKIQTPLLFYCGDGGRNKYGKIALRQNWQVGYKSDESKVRSHKVSMLDNNFKDYNHQQHLEEIKFHKPLIATALDVTKTVDLSVVLNQAQEISNYCGRVILIPKCIFELPTNFSYWLGYSIPTSYGGTLVPVSFFNKPTHLLGGSPQDQIFYASKLKNVVSLDGNRAMQLSKYGKSIYPGTTRSGKKIVEGCYPSFELSLINQREFWNNQKLVKWHWLDEPLFQSLL